MPASPIASRPAIAIAAPLSQPCSSPAAGERRHDAGREPPVGRHQHAQREERQGSGARGQDLHPRQVARDAAGEPGAGKREQHAPAAAVPFSPASSAIATTGSRSSKLRNRCEMPS